MVFSCRYTWGIIYGYVCQQLFHQNNVDGVFPLLHIGVDSFVKSHLTVYPNVIFTILFLNLILNERANVFFVGHLSLVAGKETE